MFTEKQFIIPGKHHKPILIDVTYSSDNQLKPIVIFCHGYKGYKDWGAWNLVAKKFAEHHFFFIKFNFSHNGGTPENPIDFPDLEAFAEDNFSKQLDDLESVMNWILTTKTYLSEADVQKLFLIGHSRGGGIVILKANENKNVTKIATWAAVDNFERAFPIGYKLEEWKKSGVRYVKNSRTHQQMPHHYQFYQDFIENKDRFQITNSFKHLKIPALLVHAKDDATVSYEAAQNLNQLNKKSELFLIESGGHTFGAKQPWTKDKLPDSLEEIVMKTISFFKS